MRPPGYLIGIVFILSVFFIGLIYFYFQKYQEYSFLSKTNLIVCIASYFLIILYFLIIISKTILRMPTIPILIHFVFGLATIEDRVGVFSFARFSSSFEKKNAGLSH